MTPLITLSVGAAHGFLELIAPRLRAQSSIAIEAEYDAVGATAAKIRARRMCDVTILSDFVIKQLDQEGLVAGSTRTRIGSVAACIAARSADTSPKFHDAAALRDSLTRAPAIFVPDMSSSTAGRHFAGIIERLELGRALRERLVECENGTVAMKRLAECTAEGAIGSTQAPEILSTPGVKIAGPLPGEFFLTTAYSAVQCSHASNPNAAETFLQFLKQTDIAREREAAGFGLDE